MMKTRIWTKETTVKILHVILWVLCALTPFASQAAATLRPPSVPLVACDPYFSIWSPADNLTDADTVHWTGKPHRLTSLVRIDGNGFRLMGKEPAAMASLPQTGLEVLPTRTIYTFEGEGVRLTLTFMTAALPEDLMIYSRPVTYVTWEVRATDGKEHGVEAYFEASPEISVNDPKQEVETVHRDVGGLAVLGVGTVEQPVLQKKGDDLRVDWGRLYLAVPGSFLERLPGEPQINQLVWLQSDRGAYLETWAQHGGFTSICAPGRFARAHLDTAPIMGA